MGSPTAQHSDEHCDVWVFAAACSVCGNALLKITEAEDDSDSESPLVQSSAASVTD